MSDKIYIFTDGACPNNGKGVARAAYAVVLWNLPGYREPFGISNIVPQNEPQTNQRAELRAMARAFQEVQERNLKGIIWIYTDSEYVLKCITEWGPQWKARGWRRAQNASRPLEHLDLLRPMIEFYEVSQHFIKIQHIRAHTKHTEFPYSGNAMADKLAVAALATN